MLSAIDKNRGDIEEHKLHCSASNAETLSEIRVHCYIFKDSLSLLTNSLEKLAKAHLKNVGEFSLLKAHERCKTNNMFDPRKYELLSRGKSPFPYEYIENVSILQETSLPPIEKFYSHLKGSTISQEDYAFAWDIWNTFNCHTIGDYMILYLEVCTSK